MFFENDTEHRNATWFHKNPYGSTPDSGNTQRATDRFVYVFFYARTIVFFRILLSIYSLEKCFLFLGEARVRKKKKKAYINISNGRRIVRLSR